MKASFHSSSKSAKVIQRVIAEGQQKGTFLDEKHEALTLSGIAKQVQSKSRTLKNSLQSCSPCIPRRTQDSKSGISPRLLDVKSAAAYLSLSTWSIRDLIESGKIPVVRIPHPWKEGKHMDRVLIDVRELDAFIDSLKVSNA